MPGVIVNTWGHATAESATNAEQQLANAAASAMCRISIGDLVAAGDVRSRTPPAQLGDHVLDPEVCRKHHTALIGRQPEETRLVPSTPRLGCRT